MLSLRFIMRRFVFVMPVFCSLLLSWLLTLRLVVLRLLVLLLRCHLPHIRLLLLLLVVRVVVFIVLTMITMDMWRRSATGRRKSRLAILHRVLVVLVLEDLRGVLLPLSGLTREILCPVPHVFIRSLVSEYIRLRIVLLVLFSDIRLVLLLMVFSRSMVKIMMRLLLI
jgi:hypothetical protein